MQIEKLSIAKRFCGPSRSGNGGYVCGRIARHLPGVVSVRLRVPPPLDTELWIERTDTQVRLLQGDEVVGEACSATLDLQPPKSVNLALAEQASRNYLGFRQHPFPHCFVCGPLREPGDGLRIFAGPLNDTGIVVAPWQVDSSLVHEGKVLPEFIWAALDCPSAFAVMPAPPGKALVLGQLTARLDASLSEGERCVVMGWPIQIEGRKRIAGSAVYTESGELIALAQAVWIEVPESAFQADPL